MTALGGYGIKKKGVWFRAKDLFTRDRPAAPTASGPYGPPLTPRRLPKRGGTSRTGQALPPARAPTLRTRSPRSRRDPRAATRAGSRTPARRAPRTGRATSGNRRLHVGAPAASTRPGRSGRTAG